MAKVQHRYKLRNRDKRNLKRIEEELETFHTRDNQYGRRTSTQHLTHRSEKSNRIHHPYTH
jgi:hypothetical protein